MGGRDVDGPAQLEAEGREAELCARRGAEPGSPRCTSQGVSRALRHLSTEPQPCTYDGPNLSPVSTALARGKLSLKL